MISSVLPPLFKVSFSAARQVISPCRFERFAGIIECRSSAVSLFAGIAQILRMSSVARFHCETVSAIMLVDFMAAWLSWA